MIPSPTSLKKSLFSILVLLCACVGYSQGCDMTARNMIKYLGTTAEDKATIVERIGAEGYIVGGAKVVGGVNYFYLARLDLCGEVLWENVYNEGTYAYPAGIVYTGGFIYVSSYLDSPNKTSLVKFDLNGNVLDCRKFGVNATYARRMQELSDGNFIYSGTTNAPGGSGSNDFYLTKSTPGGTILWNKQVGGTSNDFGHNIIETSDGGLLAVGYTRDYLPGGIRRGLVMKFDAVGNVTWAKEYHNGADISYIHFAAEIAGAYYFTGRGNNGTSGGYDGLIIKTDLAGNIIWSKFIGTSGEDVLLNLAPKDGVIYVSGIAHSPTKGDEIIVLTMDYAGNLLDYTSLGTASDEIGNGAFVNFNVEADGFYGIAHGNTGLIGSTDILFYRFNSFAENCDPSDVELIVLDPGIISNSFATTSISPSWTFTTQALSPTPVPDNQGFICETLDSVACDSLITIISDTIVCAGEMVTLEATSINGGTITWDGGVLNGIPFIPPTGTTIYTATSDSTTDCTFSVEITALPPPPVVANVDNTDICLGETVIFTGSGAISYTWDMGVTDGIPFEPLVIGTETYTVTGTDAFGCTNQDSIAVNVHEIPVAHFEFVAEGVSSEMGGTGGCIENPVQFNDLSTVGLPELITSWAWTFGDGGTSSLQNPTHTYAATGSYPVTLTITTANGCTATYNLTIVMTGLTLNITAIEPSCYGFSDGSVTANITGESGALTFVIEDADGFTKNVGNSNTANTLETGWYYISVTDAAGCTTNGSIFLDQPDSLEANFSFSPTNPKIDQEVVFTDHTIGATTWDWDFGDGNGSTTENPRHTYTGINTYTITLNVSDGVCTGIATATITIADNLVFYIPNTFTPDGDAYNNTFFPVFTSGFDPYDYHLTIFNRWGEPIFESFNALNGWDGTYGNRDLVQNGVYIWQIEFGDALNDDKYSYFGHVTILK